tara:strand:- start:539 stop:1936 length:1398 start_codon:yes stop_codon:yes gene_type:complete
MGFLRKVFKKIGRGIKKAFKAFGKFMGKIGILGQVAMMFILPGIGQAIGGAIKGFIGQTAAQAGAQAAGTAAASAASASAAQAGASAAAQAAAGQAAFKTAAAAATKAGIQGTATGLFAGGTASQAAGHFLQFAGKVASSPFKAFQSVTNAVTSTIGEFTKTAASKLGMNVQTASKNFFTGPDSAISRVGQSVRSPFSATARAEIATRKATQLLTKEGVDSQFLKVSEAVNMEFPEVARITDEQIYRFGTADLNATPETMRPITSVEPQPVTDLTVQADTSLLTPKSTDLPFTPDTSLQPDISQGMDITEGFRAAKQKALSVSGQKTFDFQGSTYNIGTGERLAADLKNVGTGFIDYTSEGIAQKKAALTDPAAVLQAGASAAQKLAAEQEYLDMQSQMLASSGEVVNLGIIQNPEAMLGSSVPQVMQSPIQGLQAPATYNAPLSAWGQQFMFDPFNPQMARGIS